jgi:hypothetical protein
MNSSLDLLPSHPAASRTALSPAVEDHHFDQEDTDDEEEQQQQQQQFGLRPFPVRAGEVVAVRGDPRTSQEGPWWLAELLQPLALGTTHVRVRWFERDFVRQQQRHDASRVYRRTTDRPGQTIHTATIFALGVGYSRISEILVQVNLLTANELDRHWYEFDCQVEHSVDTARPAGSRTKRRRSETFVGSQKDKE